MKWIIQFVLLLSLILVSTQADAQQEADAYQELNDISYLSPEKVIVDSLQRLNLVLPKGVEKPPLLLWIGGGAWSFVNRHMEMDLARKVAGEGIAVASVGHQLSSGAFSSKRHATGIKHPKHIQDVAAAFKWLYDHAAEYGYDQRNIFVGGFSSGAHLAALLGTDKRYLEAEGLGLDHIRGLLPVAGAYDIVDYYNAFYKSENPQARPMAETHVKDVFGDTKADFIDASPTNYLDQLKAPMLVISERGGYNYTQVFEERLVATDYTDYQILHVFDFDHGGLWRNMSFDQHSLARNVLIDFIRNKVQ